MARTLFGQGMRGEIPQSMQEALASAGFDPGRPDGVYGPGTARALKAFQRSKSLPEDDSVDAATWRTLMGSDPPALPARALGLTAAIEGHGYSLALGNWDQAWLTWGIIGFTLKHGEVQRIVLQAQQAAPELLEQAFGVARAAELIGVMRSKPDEQLRWANAITVG
jgi:hypothetical protein